MNSFSKQFALAGVAALVVGLVGCDRSDDYGPTSSGSGSVATERSEPASPASPASPDSPNYAAAPSDQAAPASSTSPSSVIDDSVITTKVKAALLADSEVKGTDINVETQQGVVQLSGFVDTKAQASKAVTLARNVEGVKSVDNKMNVKG